MIGTNITSQLQAVPCQIVELTKASHLVAMIGTNITSQLQLVRLVACTDHTLPLKHHVLLNCRI
ncbi:hypothetical protein J6590_100231 [Homalodisca vitripennis]|nr:hypothetical protein J6590_100231 [Homalodisca vitripennis]